jgi:hypothetical protein
MACPITGELVSRETCHIDHAPPWTFDAMVSEFAVGRGLLDEVEPTADGRTTTRFRDGALSRAFAEFHRGLASLRVVSRKANLGVLRRKVSS